MAMFQAILADWTNAGYDPFAAPQETGSPFGDEARRQPRRPITRTRVTAKRMVGVPGDETMRSDDTGYPVNRMFADVDQAEPEVACRARLRGRGGGVQPVRLPVAQRRHLEPVGRVGVQGQPLLPDDRGVHPADHPRQRPGRVVRAAVRPDPLEGRGPRDRSAPGHRGDEGRRRGRHARRHPPSGLLAEAVDAARLGERLAGAARPDRRGQRRRTRSSCRWSSRLVRTAAGCPGASKPLVSSRNDQALHRRASSSTRSAGGTIEVLDPHDGSVLAEVAEARAERRRPGRGGASARVPRPGRPRRRPSGGGCCCGSPTPSSATPTSWPGWRRRDTGHPLRDTTRPRRAPHRGHLPLLRRAWPTSSQGSVVPVERRVPQLRRPRAARRGRADRALELPADVQQLEAGPGARRRQHGGDQAGRADAAVDAAAVRADGRGRLPAGRRERRPRLRRTTAGARLAEHPGVAKVRFTGSTATGRRIVEASAGNLKRRPARAGRQGRQRRVRRRRPRRRGERLGVRHLPQPGPGLHRRQPAASCTRRSPTSSSSGSASLARIDPAWATRWTGRPRWARSPRRAPRPGARLRQGRRGRGRRDAHRRQGARRPGAGRAAATSLPTVVRADPAARVVPGGGVRAVRDACTTFAHRRRGPRPRQRHRLRARRRPVDPRPVPRPPHRPRLPRPAWCGSTATSGSTRARRSAVWAARATAARWASRRCTSYTEPSRSGSTSTPHLPPWYPRGAESWPTIITLADAVAEPRARRRHRRARGVHPPHPVRRRARDHPPGPARPDPGPAHARRRLRPDDRHGLRPQARVLVGRQPGRRVAPPLPRRGRARLAAPLELEEHSHAGMANRYVAGASGLPFAVLRGYAGTDLPGHTANVAPIACPFTGEELTAVAALRPDVTIIHAQRADRRRERAAVGHHRRAEGGGAGGRPGRWSRSRRSSTSSTPGPARSCCRRGWSPRWPWCRAAPHPSYAHGYSVRDNAFYEAWDAISRDRDTFLAWMHGPRARPRAEPRA